MINFTGLLSVSLWLPSAFSGSEWLPLWPLLALWLLVAHTLAPTDSLWLTIASILVYQYNPCSARSVAAMLTLFISSPSGRGHCQCHGQVIDNVIFDVIVNVIVSVIVNVNMI